MQRYGIVPRTAGISGKGLAPGPGCPGTQSHRNFQQTVLILQPGLPSSANLGEPWEDTTVNILAGSGFALQYNLFLLLLSGIWSDICNAAGLKPAHCGCYLGLNPEGAGQLGNMKFSDVNNR